MTISRDTTKQLRRASTRFSIGTLFSRLTGLLRDSCMANAFGDHPLVGAFLQSFRFSNTMRRILGEGAMLATFVPIYEDLKKRDPERACQFYKDLIASLALSLCAITILIEIVLLFLLWLTPVDRVTFRMGLIYSQLMWPGVIFICLSALNNALLQCENRFFLAAVSPMVFNFAWCAGALYLTNVPIGRALQSLCIVTVFAYIAQWALTAPTASGLLQQRAGGTWRQGRFFSTEIRQMIKPLSLGIVGVAGSQINALVDSFFAFEAESGGPTHLWYAMRLWQAPLSLFGIAVSGVTLPAISRAIQAKRFDQAREFLGFALRRSFLFMAPAMLALMAIGFAAIRLVFERGKFPPETSLLTARCLWAYALGLVPQTFVLLLSNVLYGLRLYRVTTMATLASIALNITCNAVFVYIFRASSASIALATSLSSFLNLWILMRFLKTKYPHLTVHLIDQRSRRVFYASLLAALGTLGISHCFFTSSGIALFQNAACQSATTAERLASFTGQLLLFAGLGSLLIWGPFRSPVDESLKMIPDEKG